LPALRLFLLLFKPPDARDEVDLEEKASLRSVKRKLLTPKHGWLDAQGKVHQKNFNRHHLLQKRMDILWKMRKALREQSEAASDEINKAERAPGVRRRNLHDPRQVLHFMCITSITR
jgi:hypothetical protein